MCLLVMAFGLDPEAPLLVAANRDERLDRRATAMTVLSPGGPGSGPRILGRPRRGGRRDLAGRERPRPGGRPHQPTSPRRSGPRQADPGSAPPPPGRATGRRPRPSRTSSARSPRPTTTRPGSWSATAAPSSPSTSPTGDRPTAISLDPGLHILENAPLGAPSRKVDHVRSLLGPPSELVGPGALEKLRSVLADHTIPDRPTPAGPTPTEQRRRPPGRRPPKGAGPRLWPPASTPTTTGPAPPPSSASPGTRTPSRGPLRRGPSLHGGLSRRHRPLDESGR